MEVKYLYRVTGTSSRKLPEFSRRIQSGVDEDKFQFTLDILLDSQLTMGLIPELLKLFGYAKPDEAPGLFIDSVKFISKVSSAS